jgi:hypothetical protein
VPIWSGLSEGLLRYAIRRFPNKRRGMVGIKSSFDSKRLSSVLALKLLCAALGRNEGVCRFVILRVRGPPTRASFGGHHLAAMLLFSAIGTQALGRECVCRSRLLSLLVPGLAGCRSF